MSVLSRIGISFYLRTDRKNQADKSSIYLLLSYRGEALKISTGLKVSKLNWDAHTQQAIGKDKLTKSINTSLITMKAKVVEAVNMLSINNKAVTLDNIRELISDNAPNNQKSLLNAGEQHNLEMKSLINIKYCYKTYQYYATTLSFLRQFLQQKYNRKDILLTELDVSFAKNFANWVLLNTSSTNNGMAKHIQRFKKIINWSIREGWINHNPIATYRVNFNKHERGFLTLSEVALVESTPLKNKTLETIREQFVFQIYTGLAHSDLVSLEWKHIQYKHEGNDWIIKPREKTNVLTTVPLLPKAKEILAEHAKLGTEGAIFKSYTNQPYNRYLKLLAAEIGLKKRLTSHLARHTFATTITLSNGIPIETVSRMLGHTKISTTQVYSKVTIGKIAKDMNDLANN